MQRCLEAGDALTGVSVLYTQLKMDSGPVLRQVQYPLQGHEQAPELLNTLFELGTEALIAVLPEVWAGSAQQSAQVQDEEQATEAPKLAVSEAQCCFARESAAQVHNKVRAFAIWPGTWAYFTWGDSKLQTSSSSTTAADGDAAAPKGTKLKLIRTEVGLSEPGVTEQQGSTVSLRNGALEIRCRDGSMLRVLTVQPEGKKPMDAKSFVNGLRGSTLSWVDA